MRQSIMLVDDDETFLQIAGPILESNEFQVRAMTSVANAERSLRESLPDLIISDIEMPEKNGLEFFRTVHTAPGMQNVPFIFLTANSDLERMAEGKELGSDDYLTKPVNYKLLLATVKGKLKRKEILRTSQYQQIETIKGQLFKMFSHEMRTPLTSIVGATEILADPDSNFSPEEMTTFLEMLRSNSRRLTTMFDDFLMVTRLEAGDFKDAYYRTASEMDLPSIAGAVVMQTEVTAIQRSITVRTDIPAGTVTIGMPSGHLENILSRLVENAVKFSPEGSEVQLSAGVSEDAVLFSIADTGPGIPAEAHPNVFTKFWQLQRDIHEQQGLGLGLFIAKQLTEGYGGSMWFTSEAGKGSIFFAKFHRSPSV